MKRKFSRRRRSIRKRAYRQRKRFSRVVRQPRINGLYRRKITYDYTLIANYGGGVPVGAALTIAWGSVLNNDVNLTTGQFAATFA